jgi:hypothetical protein
MDWIVGVLLLCAIYHDGKNAGKNGARRGKSNGGGFGLSGILLIAFVVVIALGG